MENGLKGSEVNCEAIAHEISALHDGEPIGREAAEHIGSCPACQRRAREYANIRTELRLSSLRDAVDSPSLPALHPKAGSKLRHIVSFLSGCTVLPRAIAATAVLAIVALSVSLVLLVNAQVDGPWVQYSISLLVPQDGPRGETEILQSPSMAGGAWVMRGPAQTIAYTLRTLEVRDGKARLEIGVRGFPGMVDYETALEIVKSSPTLRYWYTPGEALEIPVEGIASLRLEAAISETQPVMAMWARRQIGEDELRLDRPVVLRGKEVVCEGAGGTRAAGVGYGGALKYYVPGEGMFVISLVNFANAIEGTADGSVMEFKEGGMEYRIFSHQPVAGGEQPRPIWIQRDSSYQPQDSDTPSLSAGGIKTAE